MASLEQLREATKTTLEAGITGLHVYNTVPDAPNVLPCVIVIPFTTDFAQAMGRGLDEYVFDLLVLVSTSETDIRQDELDSYVTGAGSSSIRQVISNNKTLGLTNTDAYVSEMTEYGMRFPAAEVEHIGARLKMIVHTIGTS
jgi:hypothetical protein